MLISKDYQSPDADNLQILLISKDFQSPDIYALRRRQAQVDAARVGATRLRRSSTTMKLLSLPATVSKQDFGEAVPFMSRKRVDSLGMVHQQSESFDEGTHDNLFGGESSDDDDEEEEGVQTNSRNEVALKRQLDLLELELQEKSMELKLAAEIGQMLLEKEQTLSERCKRYETDTMRFKTEMQELDNENQVLHQKFTAAQKKNKDFQNENFRLSEETREIEKDLHRLKILAAEGEKVRAALNNANVQLMTLKNENRKLRKRESMESPRLRQIARLASREEEAVGAPQASPKLGSESAEGVLFDSEEESPGNTAHSRVSVTQRFSPVDVQRYASSSMGNEVDLFVDEEALDERKLSSDSNALGDDMDDVDVSVTDTLNSTATSIDTIVEVDKLRDEVKRFQTVEQTWKQEALELTSALAEYSEKSEQATIELEVSKQNSQDLHKLVMKLEKEAEENREVIESLRGTLEEYKEMLEEHEYYAANATTLENKATEKKIDELTGALDRLEAENASLKKSALEQDSAGKKAVEPKAVFRPKSESLADLVDNDRAKQAKRQLDPKITKRMEAPPPPSQKEDHVSKSLRRDLNSKREELESIKSKLMEKEMDLLKYKNIAMEWRKAARPSFLIEANNMSEQGYTAYKITLVHHDGKKHETEKRYSDFAKFHTQLERTLFLSNTVVRLPQIPPKIWGRRRSMSVVIVNSRREGFKDFLTVMAALTEASGEIAKEFWEFLDYVPEERNFQLMSFDVKPDIECLDTALKFSSTPCDNASDSKSVKRGIRERGAANAPGKTDGDKAPKKSRLPPRPPKPSV